MYSKRILIKQNMNLAIGSGSHAQQKGGSSGIYVNYGCGFTAPKEWTNFDASPTLLWERIPVIGKMYPKNTVAVTFCSFLELQ